MCEEHAKEEVKELVRTGYNRCAQRYADIRHHYESLKHVKELAQRLPKGAKILDAGCGSGLPVAKFLLDNGFDVLGIDISEEQVRLAKRNLPYGKFVVADMTTVEFPENSFDAIVSFYTIFHVPRQEHLTLLRNFYKILKPGGYLLVTMGASEWEGIEDFHGVKMFWSHYDTEKNISLVKESRFEIIRGTIDKSMGERHLIIQARKST